MRVSIIVPIFNDAASVPELIVRSSRALGESGFDAEFILVDDGSTAPVMASLRGIKGRHGNQKITLIRLGNNYGQNIATLCGIQNGKSEYIVTMDADLQHPPEEIPRLLDHLITHDLGLVYGTSRKGHPVGRRLASAMFKALIHFFLPKAFDASSFRALTRETAIALMELERSQSLLIDVALYRTSPRTDTIATGHGERQHGRSLYSWKDLFLLAGAFLVQGKVLHKLAILLGLMTIALGLCFAPVESTPVWAGLAVALIALALVIELVGVRLLSRRTFSTACIEEIVE